MAIFPPRSQDVRSAYAELRVPLFGKANARPGLQGLDVQLAARYDDYRSTSGHYVVWNPNLMPEPPDFETVNNASAETTGLLGVNYTPVQGLSIRARDRQSGVSGKSVVVSLHVGGRRFIEHT